MDTKQRALAVMEMLPALDWVKTPIHVKRLSKDFHWFSPVLSAQLAGKVADIIVKPTSLEEIKQLVTHCVAHSVPLTIRGGGTGNYGQAVPLQGGIVVDLTRFSSLLDVTEGVVTVEPGIKIADLEAQIDQHGLEMRCMPSTYRMATVGGLFAGGFGGIGSINYGPVAAHGTVLSVKVLTIEAEPQLIEYQGADLKHFHHTYGTNGILVEMRMATAPKRSWDEYMLAFPSLNQAFDAAYELAYGSGMEKRNVALFNYSSAQYLPHGETIKPDEFLVIAIAGNSSRQPLEELIADKGGRIAWRQFYSEFTASDETLMESCWNHATLHALKFDKTFTYLQAAYDSSRVVEQVEAIKHAVDDEVTLHLEFILSADKSPFITGLPLVRYQSDERLAELIALHRDNGIGINNPHVYTLEDGKHSGSLSDEILLSKKRNDPNMLLNPGKIRTLSQVA